MSISKSYNKRTGTTYVYEVLENRWDKETGKQVQKRRCIGKIDPVTGDLIPSKRIQKEAAAAASTKTDSPSTPSKTPSVCDSSGTPPLITRLKKDADYLTTMIQSLRSREDSLSLQLQEISSQIQEASTQLEEINTLLQNYS